MDVLEKLIARTEDNAVCGEVYTFGESRQIMPGGNGPGIKVGICRTFVNDDFITMNIIEKNQEFIIGGEERDARVGPKGTFAGDTE